MKIFLKRDFVWGEGRRIPREQKIKQSENHTYTIVYKEHGDGGDVKLCILSGLVCRYMNLNGSLGPD